MNKIFYMLLILLLASCQSGEKRLSIKTLDLPTKNIFVAKDRDGVFNIYEVDTTVIGKNEKSEVVNKREVGEFRVRVFCSMIYNKNYDKTKLNTLEGNCLNEIVKNFDKHDPPKFWK